MPRADIWEDGVATRFKKGAGGRPKAALSIKSRLKKICKQTMMYESLDGWTVKEKKEIYTIIAEKLIVKAIYGDLRAIKIVTDYVDEPKE
jgi:hypothetical protein